MRPYFGGGPPGGGPPGGGPPPGYAPFPQQRPPNPPAFPEARLELSQNSAGTWRERIKKFVLERVAIIFVRNQVSLYKPGERVAVEIGGQDVDIRSEMWVRRHRTLSRPMKT